MDDAYKVNLSPRIDKNASSEHDESKCVNDSTLSQHPFENELNEIFNVSHDENFGTNACKGTSTMSESYGPRPQTNSIQSAISGNHNAEENKSLSLNSADAADLQAPVELNIPQREQRSSLVVFLEITAFAMALKFVVCYLLTLCGMDEETWTTYILMQSVLFPAGIFVGFIRLNKSFLAMPDLEKTKIIQWNLNKSKSSPAQTLQSPPFLTLTTTKTFSIFNLLNGRSGNHIDTHTCNWSLTMKRHPENKDEFQFGLKALELRKVQGIGLNVYFRINGKEMFITYHPFKKQGDFGTTSFVKIPALDDDIAITCQLQCLYFYI